MCLPGLDVFSDEILEVALTADFSMAQFATTVLPASLPVGAGVHGIEASELLSSSPFNVVFHRLLDFIHGVVDNECGTGGSDTDEDADPLAGPPAPKQPPSEAWPVAHNGLQLSWCRCRSCSVRVA